MTHQEKIEKVKHIQEFCNELKIALESEIQILERLIKEEKPSKIA